MNQRSSAVWLGALIGAVLAAGTCGIVACSGGKADADDIGKKWRERHGSNGNVVSDVTVTVTSVDSNGNATCSITCGGGASATATVGGNTASASTGSPGSIVVPAGTKSGKIECQSDPPGLAPVGAKTLSFWSDFK